MKHLSLLVLIIVILFGCNNINELTQTDALSQNNKQKSSQNFPISEEEMLCKEKISTFTNAFYNALIQHEEVVNFINNRIKIKRQEYLPDRVFISDLLEENNDTLTEFIFDIKNILETNGEDWGDYVTFLNDNNISIFCPIPLEDYNDVEFPTVVPEPINNYNVSMGYEFQYPEFKIVPVDYNYLDTLPVWIIQRDEYKDYTFAVYPDDSNNNISTEMYEYDSTATYSVVIDEILIKEQFGLYENKYEFAFIKGQQSNIINPSDLTASAGFDNLLMAYIRPKNIRKARKGLEEGWVRINLFFDQAWKPNEIEQVLAIYEVDAFKKFNISGTVKYKLETDVNIGIVTVKAGEEITVSCQSECQTTFKNFVGCMQYDRQAFLGYMMSNNQNNYFNNSYLRNGNVIQSMNQNFYYTCTKKPIY